MQDVSTEIEYKGKKYKIFFTLNVMEEIQEKYGTLQKWGALTDGSDEAKGEPDAKAIIFGFTKMINEGIEIQNEETGSNNPPMTFKQVGRLITCIGLEKATGMLNKTVIESTQNPEKNE